MPAYYAPIKIDREPKEVKEVREVEIPGVLTVASLDAAVKEMMRKEQEVSKDAFPMFLEIYNWKDDEDRDENGHTVYVTIMRRENEAERQHRVKKAEDYMRAYKRYHGLD